MVLQKRRTGRRDPLTVMQCLWAAGLIWMVLIPLPSNRLHAAENSQESVASGAEMPEPSFLDLVEKIETDGLVLITARGAKAVEAEARNRGLLLPGLGYWSPEGRCFSKTTTSECSGIFRR